MSPTARSLKLLRDDGWHVSVVEKWNPHSKTRNDLFGVGDLLAIRGDIVALVQVTSAANLGSRRIKIGESLTPAWWKTGNRIILLHGWAKKGPRGKRKLWMHTQEEL